MVDVVPGAKLLITGETGVRSSLVRVDFSAFRDALGFEAAWSIPDGAAELYKEYISAGLTADDFAKKFTRLPHLEIVARRWRSRRVDAADQDRCLSNSAQLPALASRAEMTETRQRPVDRKIWVVVGDGQVLGGIMRTIDPITNIGDRGQRLEAMQEARRNVQMPKVVVVEQKCLLLAEGRRILPDVDQHIVHGTVGTADQLGLAAPGTSVHAADHPFRRTGLGILHERGGDTRRAKIVVENVRVEGPREQAAVVAKRLRNEDKNVREGGLFDVHREMLP